MHSAGRKIELSQLWKDGKEAICTCKVKEQWQDGIGTNYQVRWWTHLETLWKEQSHTSLENKKMHWSLARDGMKVKLQSSEGKLCWAETPEDGTTSTLNHSITNFVINHISFKRWQDKTVGGWWMKSLTDRCHSRGGFFSSCFFSCK